MEEQRNPRVVEPGGSGIAGGEGLEKAGVDGASHIPCIGGLGRTVREGLGKGTDRIDSPTNLLGGTRGAHLWG